MGKITLYTKVNAPIATVFDCARSIDLHVNSMEHTNEQAIAGKMTGLCELNDEVTWRAKHFGIYQKLSVKITKFEKPSYFQDCMVSGAFAYFKHDHYFEEVNDGTLMKDVFQFGVPYGIVGKLVDALILKKYMTNLLTKRNEVIKVAAENNG